MAVDDKKNTDKTISNAVSLHIKEYSSVSLFKKSELDRNLYSYPIWSSLKFKDNIRIFTETTTNDDGSTTIGKIKIESSNLDGKELGVLNTFDCRVLTILFKLYEKDGTKRTANGFYFQIIDIVNELGDSKGGNIYESIRESLRRLRFDPVSWEGIYIKKDSVRKNVKMPFASFTILQGLSGVTEYNQNNNSTKKEFVANSIYVEFDDNIIQNMRNGFTTPLMINSLLSLKGDISIVFYLYLNTSLLGKPEVRFHLNDIMAKFGLAQYKYDSEKLRAFEPCLKEVVGKSIYDGTIRGYDVKMSNSKEGYVVYIYKDEIDKGDKLIGTISENGLDKVIKHFNTVFKDNAGSISIPFLEKYSKSYSPDQMIECIDVAIGLHNIGDKIPSPGGWLRKCFEGKWDLSTSKSKIQKHFDKISIISKSDNRIEETKFKVKSEEAEIKYLDSILAQKTAAELLDIEKMAKDNIIKAQGKLPEAGLTTLLKVEKRNVLRALGYKITKLSK